MRVVIGEDEALLRRGLTLLLEGAGIEVAAAAADADQLLQLTGTHAPDMVTTDVRMPPTYSDEGMVAALQIAQEYPAMSVVVLSQHVQRRYAVELLAEKRSGIGYLRKQLLLTVLIREQPGVWWIYVLYSARDADCGSWRASSPGGAEPATDSVPSWCWAASC